MNAETINAKHPWLIAVVVSLATFMEVLDTTITNVSLSHIAGTLGASQDESTWVLTSYLVANGIVLPISGWLSGVLGRKRYFMMCIAAFTVASLACGMANSLALLIAFRLIQGLAGGGLQPTQQAIIIDAFPPEKRGTVFAITGITMIVAPILGPTLGGLITDNFSWRWIFFMNVPVGAIAFLLVDRLVVDPPHAKAKGLLSIDYIGLSLIAIGLGALQIMLDKGQQEDWFASHMIVTAAITSAICLTAAVWWLLHQEDPVIDLRLLTKPSFSLACVMIFFMGCALYGCSTLLPLLVQSQYGYDATLAGMVLSPGGLAIIFLMPVSGKLVGRVQARYLIATGMALLTFSLWYTMHITPQTDYLTFVKMRITQVVGLPFLFIPISTMAFLEIPKEKSSKASAIYALARNIGGSIGIALLTSYEVRHEQVAQTQLVQHLSPADPVYRSLLARYADAIQAQGAAAANTTHLAMGKIYQQLLHQSAIMAYRDSFMAMGYVTAVLVIVALMMPRNNPANKPKTAEAAH
jgi:DHA2 family multidrug resistance protein